METYNVSHNYNLNILIMMAIVFIGAEQGENRLKTTVYEAREIDYNEYNDKLIRKIKEMAALE